MIQWLTDLNKAKEKALAEQKLILIDFTGSDWCPWCTRIEQEIFSQEPFQKYAVEKFVMVKLDFPRLRPQSPEVPKNNRDLAEFYGVDGFPTVLICGAAGDVLLRTGFRHGGAEEYVAFLKQSLAHAGY